MARFVFRLEAALKQRERIEDDRKADLAVVQRALVDAERQRDYLKNRREELAVELSHEHTHLDGETLRISYAHMGFLAREINIADAQVVHCARLAGLAREALIVASKDRKVLEKLRETRYKEYQAEQERKEQRELDDANSRQHARTMREGVRT